MATLLNNSPSATQLEQARPAGGADGSQASPDQVGADEQAASPYEEHMLDKVMGGVFHMLNNPQQVRTIEGWLMKAPDVGQAIGMIAFKMLASVYQGATHAGVQIPPTVFFGQGGAAQETIDRLLMLAEHAGVPHLNPDQVREDALGVVVEQARQMFGTDQHAAPAAAAGAAQAAPQPPGPPASQMMRANPMAHAVGQGLQQQGLMNGG